VLIAILKHGATDARLARLSDVASVDRRSIARWRRWWRDGFTATPFWRIARGSYLALNPGGRAGFVMANSASDAPGSKREFRRKLIDIGAVDCMPSDRASHVRHSHFIGRRGHGFYQFLPQLLISHVSKFVAGRYGHMLRNKARNDTQISHRRRFPDQRNHTCTVLGPIFGQGRNKILAELVTRSHRAAGTANTSR
jgi:hypothetical protein